MGQSVQNLQDKKATTVNDHIRELLTRLFMTAVIMVIIGIIVFVFYGPVLAFLSSPLGSPLYYNTPAGSFNFVMKICLTGALIVTTPVITFNIIMFVRPAFKKALSMKRILVTTGISTLLAISGAAFAFYVILPASLKFFSGFQVSGLHALISADSYLGFITNLIIMFVLVFQIPLLMIFIDHIKPLKPMSLIRKSRWIIVGSVIVAIIQPFTYDLMTSLLIVMPIIALYYLSIVAVVIQHARVKRKELRAFNAVMAKPVIVSTSQMTIDQPLYESLTDELSNLGKSGAIPARVHKPVTPLSDDLVMDFKKTTDRAEVAVPAWVLERKARQVQFSKKVNVFSDIIRQPSTSHALASQ